MIEVHRSTVIAAPAERVWALVRDFNAMPEWNATIRKSVIENGPAHRIGCRRVLTFDDGSVWTHELTALSNAEMTIAYTIVEMPLLTQTPMQDYHAVIRVEPAAAADRCHVTWRATIETEFEEAVRERAGAVFDAGLEGLKRRLEV